MSSTALATHREVAPSIQDCLALELAPVHDFRPPPGPRPGCDIVAVSPQTRTEVERWAHQYAQAAIEAVCGDRPIGQLARVTSTPLYQELERRARVVLSASQRDPRAPRLRTLTARPAVQRVSVSFIDHTIVESAVSVRQGARLRALAIRFEFHRERWIATQMEFA